MGEMKDQISVNQFNPEREIQYLLQELEFQHVIETKARDRVEGMVQYLLTTIVAIIGGVLLVNELKVNIDLLIFIALLLLFSVMTSAFYRTCRLRFIVTYARVIRINIRKMICNIGIQQANRIIEMEGKPSGFGKRVYIGLKFFWLACSFVGGFAGYFGLKLILQYIGNPSNPTTGQATIILAII